MRESVSEKRERQRDRDRERERERDFKYVFQTLEKIYTVLV